MSTLKKRQKDILSALAGFPEGTATTRQIAGIVKLHVNGVSQSLGALEGTYVKLLGGKAGETRWKMLQAGLTVIGVFRIAGNQKEIHMAAQQDVDALLKNFPSTSKKSGSIPSNLATAVGRHNLNSRKRYASQKKTYLSPFSRVLKFAPTTVEQLKPAPKKPSLGDVVRHGETCR